MLDLFMLPNKQWELLRICEFLEPSLLFHEVQNQRSAAILRTQLVFNTWEKCQCMSCHHLSQMSEVQHKTYALFFQASANNDSSAGVV
jgi:hypothetical protein